MSRRGYRFSAEVQALEAPDRPPAHRSVRWWLAWGDTVLPLSEGENVMGRHPTSAVWIDASSVSRVHACIVIAAGRVTVEDRGSTNGTFVGGTRVTSRHTLVDGNAIVFGSERTVFRAWSSALSQVVPDAVSKTAAWEE